MAKVLFSDVYSFKFPKFHHAHAHVLEFVQTMGSPLNAATSAFEIRNGDLKRKFRYDDESLLKETYHVWKKRREMERQ